MKGKIYVICGSRGEFERFKKFMGDAPVDFRLLSPRQSYGMKGEVVVLWGHWSESDIVRDGIGWDVFRSRNVVRSYSDFARAS